jgi:hypothetical protein
MVSKTISNKAGKPVYNQITVQIEAPDGCTIEEKNIDPALIKDQPTITWLCNFAVKSNNQELKRGGPSYTVRVKLPKDFGSEEKSICVFNPDKKVDTKGKDKGEGTIVFQLDYGDPPIGVYP